MGVKERHAQPQAAVFLPRSFGGVQRTLGIGEWDSAREGATSCCLLPVLSEVHGLASPKGQRGGQSGLSQGWLC